MEFSWIAAILSVFAVGRVTRLIGFDDYPPMIWVRTRYLALLPEESAWGKLVECAFCIAPYVSALYLLGAYLVGYNAGEWYWWLVQWGALSYAAAILVAYDQPE